MVRTNKQQYRNSNDQHDYLFDFSVWNESKYLHYGSLHFLTSGHHSCLFNFTIFSPLCCTLSFTFSRTLNHDLSFIMVKTHRTTPTAVPYTHWKPNSPSFQYLLPQSFSPAKIRFSHLTSSVAINPLSIIAMSSQSSTSSSVVSPFINSFNFYSYQKRCHFVRSKKE